MAIYNTSWRKDMKTRILRRYWVKGVTKKSDTALLFDITHFSVVKSFSSLFSSVNLVLLWISKILWSITQKNCDCWEYKNGDIQRFSEYEYRKNLNFLLFAESLFEGIFWGFRSYNMWR
jgi:hypothetical protein